MTIESWLKLARKKINILDAELILLQALQQESPVELDRSYIFAHSEMELSAELREQIDIMLKRRARGEPLAYITQGREFYGRKFWVDESVLIPRVETEALIDLVKELNLPKRPHFLEIGTGSGCIAITLALEYPQAQVLATDVSEKALAVAEVNDTLYEGRVEFVKTDLLDGIDPETDEKFDVLIANLPYVDVHWDWLDLKALSFEPTEALFAKEGGLALYHRLFQEIQEKVLTHNLMHHAQLTKSMLCHGEPWIKYLVLEADPSQHETLVDIAEAFGWRLDAKKGYGLRFRV